MILQGFLDESGSGSGKTDGAIYTMAGFFSTALRWEQFSDEWEKICDREPKTLDFKMRKAIRLKEYGWTESQRDRRVGDLVDLIRQKAMYRVDAVTHRENYEMAVRGKIPRELDDPYFILFYNVILAIAELMDLLRIDGKVDFVFDKQTPQIEMMCVNWYHWIKSHVASRIRKRLGSTPIFRHDKDVLPLKAADIYAWQIRRYLDAEQPKGGTINKTVESLLNMRGVSCNIRGEDLEAMVATINSGIKFQSHATFFVPSSVRVRRKLRKIGAPIPKN